MIHDNIGLLEFDTCSTESALLTASKQGDRKAFGVLFEQNKDHIYRFVRKSIGRQEDAEDIVQEVFCRAWRSIASFRGDSALQSWLCRIAVSLCIDHSRASKSRACPASEIWEDQNEIENVAGTAPDIGQTSIDRQTLSDGISMLPIDQRMIVTLCDIQGYTCKEAAKIMGFSSVNIRVKLCRAHKKLREILTESLDEVL